MTTIVPTVPVRLAHRVLTTDEWLALHRNHGEMASAPARFPAPSPDLHWLVCECGAKHLARVDREKASAA